MRFKNKLAAVAAASAMTLGVLAPAMAAIVEPNPYGGVKPEIAKTFVGVKSAEGGREMGSFVRDGVRVFCIETSNPKYPGNGLTGAETGNNALAAYVLGMYGNTTNNRTAAAVWYILGQDAKLQTGSNSQQRNGYRGSKNYSSIDAIRKRILKEAAANKPSPSGYNMAVSITLTSDKGSGVVNFSASDASGGINTPVVITLTGDAVFTDTGQKTRTVPANTATARFPIVAKANGTVRVSAVGTTQLPSPTYTIYRNGGAQDVVVAGAKKSVSASDPTAYEVVTKYAPVIKTVSSADGDLQKVGDMITDRIVVTGGRPNATIKVQTRLYGPMTAQPKFSPNAPTGTPQLSNATVNIKLDASGNATYTTAPVQAPASGWYSYDTDFAGDDNHKPYDAGYGVKSETGFIDKYTPKMTTTASATGNHGDSTVPDGSFGFAGDVVNDTIVVEGARPNSTLEVQSRLYYSGETKPAVSPNAPASAELAETQTWTINIDATGKGTKQVTSKVMARAGWYSWDTDFAGDNDHKPYDAGYGVAEETGHLSLWSPKATTKTSDQLVTGVTELVDTVLVTNGKPGAEFSGSTTLYGPFDTDPSVDGGAVDLTKAPVVGTSTFTGAYDAEGKAEVTSEPQTTKGAGYYVWAETIDAVTLESNEFKQDKAMEAETSVEINPTITTTVNDQKVLPGHTITDKVEIDGIVNVVGGKKVTNVVTGTLYGPVAPVDGSCKAVDWTDAPVALKLDATEVTADENGKAVLDKYGTYTLPDEAASLGCYTYEETLTSTVEGDETPVVVHHEKGQESQTTIALKPGLSTQVSEQMVKPGATLTDEIKVWDTADTKFTITAKLYGLADPGENRQCSALTNAVWERMIAEGTAKVLGEETIVVDKGDGTYTTKGITLPADATGCATWWEQADFEGSESSTIITEYGIVEETATVLNPVVTTVAHHEYDYAGSLFTDTIFVKGTYGNSGVITGKVLGPIAGKPAGDGAFTCDNLDWTNAPVAGEIEPIRITGDGTFTSTSVKTSTAGCYTFVETLTMDDGDVVVNTKPGEATETNYFAEKPAEGSQAVGNDGAGNGNDDAGDGGIDAGDPMVGSWNPWAVGTGLTLMVGAGAVAAGTAIRRKRV